MRHEIVLAASANWQRAVCAALGACWQGPHKPKARYDATYNPLAYGGAVLDELAARGIAPVNIWEPAAVAYQLLADSVLTEREVAATEDFTETPPEVLTS